MSTQASADTTPESESRYLVFGLADLLFAVPLLQVRELVEYQQPKPLPNTRPSCVGAINLRGEIVGLIDLRIRFGLPQTKLQRAALMVCESSHGTIAAIVERVLSVTTITPDEIDRSRNLQPSATKQAQLHITGVARKEQDVINLLDLVELLNDDGSRDELDVQLSA